MKPLLPLWRSLLFVPANMPGFIEKAHRRGADACILDLEDSVPLDQKDSTRAAVAQAAALIDGNGLDVLVRINVLDAGGMLDVQACVGRAVRALVVPKVNSAETLQTLARELDRLEAERGLEPGWTLLLAQIEDVAALPRLDEIAQASPRLLGMSLGPEDFAVSAGIEPLRETLYWPNQQVAFACRRAGILPFGFPGSIAEFRDLPRLRENVELARQLGMVGAMCIHPAQAEVLNEILTPTADAVAYAQGLLAEQVVAESLGRAAFAYRGKMIDPPVVARARELVARSLAAGQRRSPTAET